MTQLAVLGSPIQHSRSPQLHRAAYERLGLDWKFSRIRVAERGLKLFTAGRGPEWRGLSCTMPLKEEAYRLATHRDRIAEESRVVNTLLRLPDGDGSPSWAGFNTDVVGLTEAIRKTEMPVTKTAVLGAGATAVSAILALRALGAETVTVIARREGAARDLARRFDGTSQHGRVEPFRVVAQTFDSYDGGGQTAVISTLPGPAGSLLAIHPALLTAPLFDVAYDPWPSPLAQRWNAAGTEAHSGLAMLVEQALIQLRIFVNGDTTTRLPDEEGLLELLTGRSMGG